jgi:hypothetical protein
VIPEATSIAVGLAAFCEYLRTKRGPLVLLASAVLHLRAVLVTARWVVGQVPGMWRGAYPQAVEWVKTCDARADLPITTETKGAVSSASASPERKASRSDSRSGQDAAPAMMPWLFELARSLFRALIARAT